MTTTPDSLARVQRPDTWSRNEITLGACPEGPFTTLAQHEAIVAELFGRLAALRVQGVEATPLGVTLDPAKVDALLHSHGYPSFPEQIFLADAAVLTAALSAAPAPSVGGLVPAITPELAGWFIAALGDIPDDYQRITAEQVMAALARNVEHYLDALAAKPSATAVGGDGDVVLQELDEILDRLKSQLQNSEAPFDWKIVNDYYRAFCGVAIRIRKRDRLTQQAAKPSSGAGECGDE